MILAFSASSDDVPPSSLPFISSVPSRLIKRPATTLSPSPLSLLQRFSGRLSNASKTGTFLRNLLSCLTPGILQFQRQGRPGRTMPTLDLSELNTIITVLGTQQTRLVERCSPLIASRCLYHTIRSWISQDQANMVPWRSSPGDACGHHTRAYRCKVRCV
jgi:hypothetical protein